MPDSDNQADAERVTLLDALRSLQALIDGAEPTTREREPDARPPSAPVDEAPAEPGAPAPAAARPANGPPSARQAAAPAKPTPWDEIPVLDEVAYEPALHAPPAPAPPHRAPTPALGPDSGAAAGVGDGSPWAPVTTAPTAAAPTNIGGDEYPVDGLSTDAPRLDPRAMAQRIVALIDARLRDTAGVRVDADLASDLLRLTERWLREWTAQQERAVSDARETSAPTSSRPPQSDE